MPTNPTRDEAVAWQLIDADGKPAFIPYIRKEDAVAMVEFYQDDQQLRPCDQEVFTIRELYSAATVDALRSEVSRLREEVECERARTAGENERAQLLLDAKEHWRLKVIGMSGELERLRAFAKHARTICFDFVNEGIRPWEHHMRDLAWRADGALKGDPTP